MYPDDHPCVLNELHRRLQVRAKCDAKLESGAKKDKSGEKKDKANKSEMQEKDSDTGKWQNTHQQLAETRVLFVCVRCSFVLST